MLRNSRIIKSYSKCCNVFKRFTDFLSDLRSWPFLTSEWPQNSNLTWSAQHNFGVPEIFKFMKFSVRALLGPWICNLNLYWQFSRNCLVTESGQFARVIPTFHDLTMLSLLLCATRSFKGPTTKTGFFSWLQQRPIGGAGGRTPARERDFVRLQKQLFFLPF